MTQDYPYQLVAFLDNTPALGEPVYYGERGWYPQIALKRRFGIENIDEPDLLQRLSAYCLGKAAFTITTGGLTKPDRMPVQVLEVTPTSELMTFHTDLIQFLGDSILSRYPERDGANYLPHITAEFNGEMVIDDMAFANRQYTVREVYLLKDVADENSIAYQRFVLGE